MKHIKTRLLVIALILGSLVGVVNAAKLENEFLSPPDSARPGVYWYFMDGNLSREGMTADLESMKDVGLGNLVFLEVNVGVPRGPVDFMSQQWQELFAHAVHEAESLGIDITLGSGPGWTGSGGPWVKVEQSMQHLVFSITEAKGPGKFDKVLDLPKQRSTRWHSMRSEFYEDVIVYAFPRCEPIIADVNEKALFVRNPYTSKKGVKPYLPATAQYTEPALEGVISFKDMVDLTKNLDSDGRLRWSVPAGDWTIVRMGCRTTGASTRPAPAPGLGFECDKFDAAALDDHFENYYGKLLKKVGLRKGKNGWTTVHIDSWEMGAQNWTGEFLKEFKKRRGYDAKPYLPAYTGRAVEGLEISERFLWDVRLTAQELVLENHAGHLKKLGRRHGFELSIEPYDMNPTADLDLGAVADVPMCEFWSAGMGFDSSFSCIEASSIAHTMGRPIVSAEAFTAGPNDGWRQYPWSMKNQGDWAFCMGVNRFVYHTFAHKPLGEEYRPGMTMGPYGVHWDRGQTWWPMVKDYHRYVSRCSHLMRQGVTVSDILYLTPEGAPHVFRAPASALEGTDPLADKKGYGFDGCSPNILMARAKVRNGKIAFPGGTSYRLMVLPQYETMTLKLLAKIEALVKDGATVVGLPPVKSPSLSNYPACDKEVQSLAKELWGSLETPAEVATLKLTASSSYPNYPLQLALDHNPETRWISNGDKPGQGPTPKTPEYLNWKFQAPFPAASLVITPNPDCGPKDCELQCSDDGKTFRTICRFVVEQRKEKTVVFDEREAKFFRLVITSSYPFQGEESRNVQISEISLLKKREILRRAYGRGSIYWIYWGGDLSAQLYPNYDNTAALLKKMGVNEDFTATGPVRYGHRRTEEREIYFVSNKSDKPLQADCTFRVSTGQPQLWNPVTGQRRLLPQYKTENGLTTIPMEFDAHESFFVIFPRKSSSKHLSAANSVNFLRATPVATLQGSWQVSFDPTWGGPEKVAFDTLKDWTRSDQSGIKYYSGIATYRKSFDHPAGVAADAGVYLDLGTVHDMARVRLNGKDLGVVWCAPWRVEISDAIKAGNNHLEIEVANRWPNRMIGDRQAPDADVRTVQWPEGFLGGKEYKTGRYTFATDAGYNELLPSGLLGPVQIMVQKNEFLSCP